MKKLILKRILKIVGISVFIGILYNSFGSKGLPLIREKTELQTASDSLLSGLVKNNSEGTILNIAIDQAYSLHLNKTAIFIDARDQWDFAEGHILDAINVPEFSFELDNQFVGSLDKEYLYVIYCGSDDCEISERLAQKLQKIGFTKLAVFKAGWETWLNAGYDVELGEIE